MVKPHDEEFIETQFKTWWNPISSNIYRLFVWAFWIHWEETRRIIILSYYWIWHGLTQDTTTQFTNIWPAPCRYVLKWHAPIPMDRLLSTVRKRFLELLGDFCRNWPFSYRKISGYTKDLSTAHLRASPALLKSAAALACGCLSLAWWRPDAMWWIDPGLIWFNGCWFDTVVGLFKTFLGGTPKKKNSSILPSHSWFKFPLSFLWWVEEKLSYRFNSASYKWFRRLLYN